MEGEWCGGRGLRIIVVFGAWSAVGGRDARPEIKIQQKVQISQGRC